MTLESKEKLVVKFLIEQNFVSMRMFTGYMNDKVLEVILDDDDVLKKLLSLTKSWDFYTEFKNNKQNQTILYMAFVPADSVVKNDVFDLKDDSDYIPIKDDDDYVTTYNKERFPKR